METQDIERTIEPEILRVIWSSEVNPFSIGRRRRLRSTAPPGRRAFQLQQQP
ncbi:unnamed protein product [Pylaiella littoralis]